MEIQRGYYCNYTRNTTKTLIMNNFDKWNFESFASKICHLEGSNELFPGKTVQSASFFSRKELIFVFLNMLNIWKMSSNNFENS